jgi:hypothetical protein
MLILDHIPFFNILLIWRQVPFFNILDGQLLPTPQVLRRCQIRHSFGHSVKRRKPDLAPNQQNAEKWGVVPNQQNVEKRDLTPNQHC